MGPVSASVICVSHATGALGEEVARSVAEDLGFAYVDEEVVLAAAEHEGLEPGLLAAIERRRSGLSRLQIDVVTGGGFDEILRSLIRRSIDDAAAGGEVVIVAHAASFRLGASPGVLRALLTGSREVRARRLAEAEELSLREAAGRIASSDKGRAAYLKRFYGVNNELPEHYDLVVNTDRLSCEHAAQLLIDAASALATEGQ